MCSKRRICAWGLRSISPGPGPAWPYPATLQRRLLLCRFGLGTNAGLKRVCTTLPGESAQDWVYIRRRYLHPDALRNAITAVVNAIFRVRAPASWGAGTTACASDAKHFGA
jgi:hypothetical protein